MRFTIKFKVRNVVTSKHYERSHNSTANGSIIDMTISYRSTSTLQTTCTVLPVRHTPVYNFYGLSEKVTARANGREVKKQHIRSPE